MAIGNHTLKTVALIMAAGRGSRVGGEAPKQYQLANGQSILGQAVGTFTAHPQIEAVRVVIGPADADLYNQAILPIMCAKILSPVIGGEERSDSVRIGLESLESMAPRNVLIHDGARPFVSYDLISRVVEGLDHHKGVIPGLAVVDTLKLAVDGLVKETVDRNHLYRAQTPQGFDYQMILKAHRSLKGDKTLTDDASLYEHLGIPVHMVIGSPSNKKITTADDLKEVTMSVPDIRVGHGIDVHAIGPGNHVMLLGIKIPTNFSLIGHSDADVGLHSLTDALLGAIGDGDIGQHFSPLDDRWKGADSSVFLKDAARRVRELGGNISHVDITILGERPKIAPHRQQMINSVSQLLEIEARRVSVKATTTEKLGFVGREEGLASFATATVVF